jgi:hypothetical protein
MTVAQLTTVIRYHLSELSSQNGHHEFEHLARYLAKARVYSNVLPATGPVSAGGDGGRDFETFRTGLIVPLTAGATFPQSASGQRLVAFACTLEKKIVPKIQRDVERILLSEAVDEVVCFCESNVPVAKRQKLQAWAKKRGVILQIFDGQAIAEMLTDRDTFWIAQEYLRIPSELMPRVADDPSWYSELLNRWTNLHPLTVSRSDFMEIKAGLRYATFNLDVRQDLNCWLARMEHFLSPNVPRQLQRNAAYEVVVATYRGKGDFDCKSSLFEKFYSDVDDFRGLADLKDATTLLVYAWGANLLGAYRGPPELLLELRRRIINLLDEEMTTAPGPGRRAGLLEIRGHIETMPCAANAEPSLTAAAKYWSKMLDEAAHSPLFPVETFAINFSKILGITGPRRELLSLTPRLDDLVAKRVGAAAAGDQAFDRASAFLQCNEMLAAMQEFHRARMRLFSGDRIAGALNVMLVLSDCYRQLGLVYAAKYYAFSAAYIALHDQNPMVAQLLPRALFTAVDAEDAAGNSVGLANLLFMAIAAHSTFERDPFNTNSHPRLQENLGQMQALLGILRRGDPLLFDTVKQVFDGWPPQLSKSMLEGSSDSGAFWNVGEWEDAWSGLKDSLVDRPWGDVATVRTVRWQALGINWTCFFDNNYEVTPIAEQFIAECQLSLAALAAMAVDLALVSTTVTLRLTVSKKAKSIKLNDAKSVTEGVSFSLTIPASSSPNFSSGETVSTLIAVLRECSVFTDEQYLSAARQGLKTAAEQAFNVRPYRELYREFTLREGFFDFARSSQDRFQSAMQFPRRVFKEIGWNSSIGPTYDQAKALAGIKARYQAWTPYVRLTIRNLMKEPSSRLILQRLRDRGMKDWHILSLVGNIALSARSPFDCSGGISASKLAAFNAAIAVVETDESALGPNILLPGILGMQEGIFISLLLNHWDLDVASNSVGNTVSEEFLIARYRIYYDDVEHEDIFGWNTPAVSAPLEAAP